MKLEANPPSHYDVRKMFERHEAWLKTPAGQEHLAKERAKHERRLKWILNTGLPRRLERVLNSAIGTPEHSKATAGFRELTMEVADLEGELAGPSLNPFVEISADTQKAFRRLMQEHHPDKGGDPEKFQAVKELRDMVKAFI